MMDENKELKGVFILFPMNVCFNRCNIVCSVHYLIQITK